VGPLRPSRGRMPSTHLASTRARTVSATLPRAPTEWPRSPAQAHPVG
jgi:hypothetical protein